MSDGREKYTPWQRMKHQYEARDSEATMNMGELFNVDPEAFYNQLLQEWQNAQQQKKQKVPQSVRPVDWGKHDVVKGTAPTTPPVKREATEPLVRPDVAAYLETWFAQRVSGRGSGSGDRREPKGDGNV